MLERICEYRPAGRWVQFQCLLPHRHKNGDAHWSGLAWIGDKGELVARCQGCGAGFKELVDAVGLPQTEWFPDKGRRYEFANKGGRATTAKQEPEPVSDPVAIYQYRDEAGELLFEKLRYEPKRFQCRRPTPADVRRRADISDGVVSWVWGVSEGIYSRPSRDGAWDLVPARHDHQIAVKVDECRRVLYRLPELLAANKEAPVFLVEGEKDVETLKSLGLTAVCTWAGSGSVDPAWLLPLVDRRVVVVPDNDEVGRSHAMRCVGWLVCGGVRSVRVLWPGECGYDPAPGGDISDWLAAQDPDGGGAKASLIELCKRAHEYK
ncbi:hypothetical protein GobsT_30820 [Gemmata obscuriglobus]|uniref:Toprim domain-containing protein n=1 Tax=Gemmata obscuriglobus TaxID=114 RepID=A0A2Z3H6S0_9BACT|nr:hypothetical protein C1280_18170 [Gemmata obscuriglobus]QEG28305.1 hypothetical protein GobsT_30820 [Gemmata obscuriglobus]VTS06145.1 Uncharacterized protein OS=Nitrolancea hollandica Lb GN=NITHO_3110008 PE=4 SV=1 [Gemmata obscuriglobus UQM 2246]